MPTSQNYYNETHGLFIELFDRPAATAGYNYFGSELASGANPVTVFAQISGSSEATGVTINSIFENLLGRGAAQAALTFFGGEMAAGQTIANIASQIYTDVLNESATSQDNMVLTDKIAYANNYTGYIAANPGFTYNAANASAYINQVTTTGVMTGTVPTGANMPAVNAFVAGTTVDLLTTSSSYIEPSSAGTVNFVFGATGVTTAQITAGELAADTLQSGAGGATLTINPATPAFSSSNTIGSNLPAMSGVSTIVVNSDVASDKINISGIAGVTDLTINVAAGVFGAADVYTVSSTQTLTLESLAASTYVDVNSTGTSANVTLDNAAAITYIEVNNAGTTNNAMATLNLTVSGNNTVALSDLASTATLAALTVASTDTSAKDSTTITGITNIASVNASADQGTLTYVMPTSLASSTAFTFMGGTGTNTVELMAAPQASAANVTYAFTGNSAGTNTLAFDYTSPTASDIKTYTNDATHFTGLLFESGVTSLPTIDMAHVNSSISNVTFSSTATVITVSDATGTGSTGTVGDMFNVNQNVSTSLTISDASGSNATNLTMGGGFAIGTIDAYQSPTAGIAPQLYINIDSASSSATTGNSIGTIGTSTTGLQAADGATVNITGSNALSIQITDATTSVTPTAGLTVNAGAFTGALTLGLAQTSNNTLSDTITVGNASGNTITLGAGSDTVTVGTGTNTINAAAATYTTSSTPSATASLTGFTTITDNNYTTTTGAHSGLGNLTVELALATGGTLSAPATLNEYTTAIPTSDTQAQAVYSVVAAMTAADTSTGNYVDWFQFGGDTYLVGYSYYSTTSAHADSVVQLVGTAATLATDLANTTSHITVNVG